MARHDHLRLGRTRVDLALEPREAATFVRELGNVKAGIVAASTIEEVEAAPDSYLPRELTPPPRGASLPQ